MFSQPLSAAQAQVFDLLQQRIRQAYGAQRTADAEALCTRLKRYLPDLLPPLAAVYGEHPGFEAFVERLVDTLVKADLERPEDLRQLDLERLLAPDWFQGPHNLGYAAYTERFAGNLRGVAEHIGYLEELGVTYLHLMPLLQPRPGENDGGYAVMDYRAVRPDLGDMDDLEALARALRERGISLCLDLVLNHVAREHAWAEAARRGEARYQAYFHTYADRAVPEQYERTLPEIFPDFAPGNFSWDAEMGRWVWTTFNAWQWDLNWSNPEVFLEFVGIILYLANRGVSIFRLDAIAFIWKRMGTDCQNQPEVHLITQALRAAVRIAAPAVIFKAEAIVGPRDLMPYLGVGEHYGKVSDLAYHNSLMVQIWSGLAARDARLVRQALEAFGDPPRNTSWATYLRGHDDIGWAVSDEDAAAVGWSGEGHRRFLSDFYAGQFPGSFARGLVFQENPRTGDRRISGSAASLIGLEAALEQGHPQALQQATERLLMAYTLVLGFGGMPLLYMGDELALRNDYAFTQVPEHASDNRWVHRPRMDWVAAERRHDPGTLEGRVFEGLRKTVQVRRATPQLHAAFASRPLRLDTATVLGLERAHPQGTLVQLYNFSETPQGIHGSVLKERGILRPLDRLSGRELHFDGEWLLLEPYARLWLVNASA